MLYNLKLNIFLQKKDLLSLFSNLGQFLKIIHFVLYFHQLYLQIQFHPPSFVYINVESNLVKYYNPISFNHLLIIYFQKLSIVHHKECLLNFKFQILNNLLNHFENNIMLLFHQSIILYKFQCFYLWVFVCNKKAEKL